MDKDAIGTMRIGMLQVLTRESANMLSLEAE